MPSLEDHLAMIEVLTECIPTAARFGLMRCLTRMNLGSHVKLLLRKPTTITLVVRLITLILFVYLAIGLDARRLRHRFLVRLHFEALSLSLQITQAFITPIFVLGFFYNLQ